MREQKSVIASAPGKLILMGEHAVVYGRPALVTSIGLQCRVRVRREQDSGVRLILPEVGVYAENSWAEIERYTQSAEARWGEYQQQPSAANYARLRGSDPAHVVKIALGQSLRWGDIKPKFGICVQVGSAIPPGAGLGSSAAVASATAAAFLTLCNQQPSVPSLRSIVLDVERRQHGQASGIDHSCVLSGGLFKAASVGGCISLLEMAPTPCLQRMSVYHTGTPNESTGAVVADIAARFEADPAFKTSLLEQMESNTLRFYRLLSDPTHCPQAMLEVITEAQRHLEQLGIVPDAVRQVVREIESAGGAAKISGAGALSGTGAGALLVYWPEIPLRLPRGLRRLRRLHTKLTAPGVRIRPEGCL
ncbi:mevalonate kinase [Pseudomonas sp. R5(2019)]|uniref:mevalonate kinase family protein n=1 Tax=Pseudomonas sp. R5(2019) TaxID=2697566 RepID=UPI0014129A11|nr:hypothetical protein [Pseudomonas sp. R5(2019)]NBA96319.1 hypothetical protein [Pseudomonas sp. R5(2019)]